MLKLLKSVSFIHIVILLAGSSVFAQEKAPFWNDVQTIKAYDQQYAPPKDPILFIGSSSIRKWVDFYKSFGAYRVLNRGIGGAVTNDVDRYLNDIVFPYHPKQLVIYVGENDLISSPDAETVLNDFKKLYTDIRVKLPVVPIVYLTIKGSPSRAKYQEKAKKANLLIAQFIKAQKNIVYLDVYQPMLDKNNNMQPSLFTQDMLHMNATGYQIWNKLLIPYLLKD
ncbi:GDSL-type esterase/lipase family protein [Pedobacter sp. L105]|uniref:GDSL-type esterase/lipase family protein n=1 Tax=Pedobacter sp. L105 TaxID=1641871 RepID=UPI00131A876F|nr:GDSL-type esterase/lipase family protein [Pedobacter sp. L105]